MIIYECDMCGKQTHADMPTLEVVTSKQADFGRNVDQFMVCRECGDHIVKFVKTFKLRMGGKE